MSKPKSRYEVGKVVMLKRGYCFTLSSEWLVELEPGAIGVVTENNLGMHLQGMYRVKVGVSSVGSPNKLSLSVFVSDEDLENVETETFVP